MAAQGSAGSTNLSEVAMAIFVLLLIVLLLVELPNWVVNVSICLNITLGVVLLMISLYVKKTLELAAFPSIILIGTMFRLVLSIASTRLILSKGEAGEVIHAFGTFVTGGNMVVGGVIFLIITVVQFMVITKGAERIAEVSARFALDAMPGKQMTIDADFNAGLISPEEATQRREDLQRESNLFGSMDGAMKFVKGDTIAGIIIVLINIIGGLCVGCLMNQMPIEEAVSRYTILTIGDGLASQVPSLLMSIAAGVFMTRSSAASSSLGADVAGEILSKPYSLFFASGFLMLLAVTGPITGLPWFPFLMFSVGMANSPRKLALCPKACTPASVLLVPLISISSAHKTPSTLSTSACTVGTLGCLCQPEKSVPSYLIVRSIFLIIFQSSACPCRGNVCRG